MSQKLPVKIVQEISELPDFRNAQSLFLDIETQNNTWDIQRWESPPIYFPRKYSGMYTYGGDLIGSIAVTADACEEVYYIPLRHRRENGKYRNVQNIKAVYMWLEDQLKSCEKWVNHNVTSFDAPFVVREAGIDFSCSLVDTLTMAKLYDSDKFDQGLKTLVLEYCGYTECKEFDALVKKELKARKTKDYMEIPIEDLAQYAAWDVWGNRLLYMFFLNRLDPELMPVLEEEIILAPILCDMQVEGLRVDRDKTVYEWVYASKIELETGDVIRDIINGDGKNGHREWRNSNQCIADIFTNLYNLPTLLFIKEKKDGKWITTDRASYNKEALMMYAAHPRVISNPELTKLVKAITLHREYVQYKGLFLEPFLALNDENSLIHPSYNANVRTGRMSCSGPNIMQQNKRSKKLIIPRPGHGLISADLSQIEFRLIVHYIEDEDAIKAYNENPRTDFHEWVANLVNKEEDGFRLDRSGGKTLNFGMGYGAGKPTVLANLKKNPTLAKQVLEYVDGQITSGKLDPSYRLVAFEQMCKEKAELMYDTYHSSLSGLKDTAKEAKAVCQKRGYVKNLYGRRRHLPRDYSRTAFNTAVQSSAMDLMKNAMINLSPRYNKDSRDMGLRLAANVHDEILFEVPEDRLMDSAVHEHIRSVLETPTIDLRVPICADIAVSLQSWGDCEKI